MRRPVHSVTEARSKRGHAAFRQLERRSEAAYAAARNIDTSPTDVQGAVFRAQLAHDELHSIAHANSAAAYRTQTRHALATARRTRPGVAVRVRSTSIRHTIERNRAQHLAELRDMARRRPW